MIQVQISFYANSNDILRERSLVTLMRFAVRSKLNDTMGYTKEDISVLDGNIRMRDKIEENIVGWPYITAGVGYGRMQLCSFTDVSSESV